MNLRLWPRASSRGQSREPTRAGGSEQPGRAAWLSRPRRPGPRRTTDPGRGADIEHPAAGCRRRTGAGTQGRPTDPQGPGASPRLSMGDRQRNLFPSQDRTRTPRPRARARARLSVKGVPRVKCEILGWGEGCAWGKFWDSGEWQVSGGQNVKFGLGRVSVFGIEDSGGSLRFLLEISGRHRIGVGEGTGGDWTVRSWG